MTITEFLKDRIAEDEKKASSLLAATQEGYDINEYAERVLAECAAKQAIIAEHGDEEVASLDRATWGQAFLVCRVCAVGDRQVVAPCPTIRALSAVYKDHPDYRQEWALDG